ncbi:MAG: alpha-amylase family glycosyl hydrolase [Gemmatimonadota bacterium]|nr:alpha-amylase family glycosyl hydrolase [Gemmatimonadota bacterium]
MDLTWWQRGIIYQVYPRSFQDSNGDGVGDLRGITARLDYLVWLGIDAVWISPIYPSPMADFGYDVSDYTGIHPLFGTLEDFDRLIEAAHARGLRVILDFVPNHTSVEHPWFVASRSSRTSPKRDWYIWADPAPDGGPPTNWESVFGGSAWELDATTGQYYYHAYLREQPDLNWRNPAVRDAMHDVLRFWLRRGVDGFRVDVIWHLIKDAELRDNPPNPDYCDGMPSYRRCLATYTTDRPEVHELIAGMRRVIDEWPDRVMIGEIYLPIQRLVLYYGTDGLGAHLPFNFQLIELPWDAETIGEAVASYECALPPYGWPNWVLGNHDKHRVATRVGPAQAPVAAMLLLTLRGTPTIYYGDELGTQDVAIPPELVQDPWERNVPGLGLGRDPVRTPMQWDATQYAGFSTAAPWLPLAPDFATRNVEVQRADPDSVLSLYRRLIELRRSEPALLSGEWRLLHAGDGVLAYERRGTDRFAVLLNLRSDDGSVELPPYAEGRVAVATNRVREGEPVSGRVVLRGNEGLVVRLAS